MPQNWRRLEVGGGRVTEDKGVWSFWLPARPTRGYVDAQIDDVAGSRRSYSWRPGTRLRLEARFSHGVDRLRGTGGFGFWNAPFGDPTVPWPALPRAVWFFFASPEEECHPPHQALQKNRCMGQHRRTNVRAPIDLQQNFVVSASDCHPKSFDG